MSLICKNFNFNVKPSISIDNFFLIEAFSVAVRKIVYKNFPRTSASSEGKLSRVLTWRLDDNFDAHHNQYVALGANNIDAMAYHDGDSSGESKYCIKDPFQHT